MNELGYKAPCGCYVSESDDIIKCEHCDETMCVYCIASKGHVDGRLCSAKVDVNLEYIIDNHELLEVGRKAIEDTLIELRDVRVAVMRNNGLVVCEKDGASSSVIRMGPEQALITGLKAIAKHLKSK